MVRTFQHWGRWLILAAVVGVACQTAPEPRGEVQEVGIEAGQAVAESVDRAGEEAQRERPKRIILFIGDGMGLSQVAASAYAAGEPLAMMQMDRFGVLATHEYEYVTTDSAASATAMATGEKTHFNGVSVTPSTGPDEEEKEDHQLSNMVQAAEEAGWNSGLAATVRITHATPAPFAAHRHSRRQYDDIAIDMSESGVDVMLGAGWQYFRGRDDDRDLLEEMEQRGYTIAEDADAVRTAAGKTSKLVGLMHERDMPWVHEEARKMELDEMVRRSIEALDSDDPEGFFLMVEGAKIDWGGHRMDGQKSIEETLDMDQGIAEALEYARGRDDTLVAVTADHETGAMDLFDGSTMEPYLDELGESDDEIAALTHPDDVDDAVIDGLADPFQRLDVGEGEFGPRELEDDHGVTSFGFMSPASRAYWDGEGRFSATHTPELVPLFAEGVGANELSRLRDNADLGRQLMAWIDDEDPEVERASRLDARNDDNEPDNVILVVTDGFGMNSMTAWYYHFGVPGMLMMPVMGAVATHATDGLVNDAAGAATALGTGAKTRRGVLGKEPGEDGELQPRARLLDHLVDGGRAAGIVTSGQLTDPMPAALYGRQHEYDADDGLAEQFVEMQEGRSGLEVVAGGTEMFDDEQLQRLEHTGVLPAERWSAERSVTEMSKKALEELDDSDDGFFLTIDAGGIGEAKSQFERGEALFSEFAEFGETVEAVRSFADRRDDTLVLVTSLRDQSMTVLDNHYGFHSDACGAVTDCGGDFEMTWFDVAADEIRHGEGLNDDQLQAEFASPPEIAVQYTWPAQLAARTTEVDAPYSANFVPLFAEGPSAGSFHGMMDQSDLGRWLLDWARHD